LMGDPADMSPGDRAALKESKLEGVVVTGRQPREKFRAFQQLSDVLVIPDADRPFTRLFPPLKLYDALASGKPCVVTRVQSRMEMIEDGVTGYLVEPGNAESMAQGIGRALNAPDAIAVGQRAKDQIIANHSFRASGEKLRQLYSTILV